MEDREAKSREYGKPPWRFKGRAVYQLHLVKSQVARALIPKDFRLVEAFGYTLGGFFLANYHDSPAGAFDELVVIAGIVWNPPTSCAWASKVLVNSHEACLHGRTDVGLPSHNARFTKLTQLTDNKGQQDGRFKQLFSKIGLRTAKPSSKFDLKTEIVELDDSASTEGVFSINLLSSLPKENPKAWLGPHIKMSLPSFSGRTEYHASLLKYSCQMDGRLGPEQEVPPLHLFLRTHVVVHEAHEMVTQTKSDSTQQLTRLQSGSGLISVIIGLGLEQAVPPFRRCLRTYEFLYEAHEMISKII